MRLATLMIGSELGRELQKCDDGKIPPAAAFITRRFSSRQKMIYKRKQTNKHTQITFARFLELRHAFFLPFCLFQPETRLREAGPGEDRDAEALCDGENCSRITAQNFAVFWLDFNTSSSAIVIR